jgi:hypothetical protein
MTSVSQFESHPGVEDLSAFAEQALQERERCQVLAHLSGCSRCRQIVFLATEAALEESLPAAAVLTPAHAVPQRLNWLAGWRMAWMPAGALALLALTVTVVRWHATGPADLARLQTPPASHAVISNPSTPPREAAKTAPAEKRTVPPPAPAPPPTTITQKSAQVAVNTQWPMPVEEVRAPAPPLAQISSAPPAARMAKAKSALAYDRAEQELQSNRGGALAAARAPGANQAASFTVLPESRKMVLGAVPHVLQLPSGQAPVAVARGAERVLALDASGALYLSVDQGATWKQVPAQWAGHAVALRLHSNTAKAAPAAPSAAPQTAAAPPNATAPNLFELSNNQGQLWLSLDGLTWTAR